MITQIVVRLLSDILFYVTVLVFFVMMRDVIDDAVALLLTGALLEVYVLAIYVHLSSD